ncbi:MAG TPA: undecaprenyl-diphosphatase UppP [Candidatus Binatia bacterium]|jgi:undecaprenyl-diphosphatase|nr:undecaprenyl-diphosphatase UppP [Candidatus Binatia bacterium]
MHPLIAAVLGVVEGLTEFLPVSSTGHLILASRLLGLAQTEFVKSFEIAIQLGAIMAVVVLYRRTLFGDIEAMKRVIVGFIPTGILGLVLYKVVKRYLLGSDATVLWALFLGGIVLIAFELLHKSAPGKDDDADVRKITYRQALVIGACQSLAMVPGVSRSAASVVGGLAQGIDRRTTVRFSFLLAVPTMLAATGLDLVKSRAAFASVDYVALAIGTAVSFVVALAAVKFLLKYVRTHTFIPFGVYRIAAALAFWALVK